MINIEVISITLGSIGTLTGVISLILHILNSRPKLKAEAYFTNRSEDIEPRGHKVIYITITFRNVGMRSLTAEDLYISIGDMMVQHNFKPVILQASSSEKYSFSWCITEKEYDRIFKGKPVLFNVFMIHTFGYTSVSGESRFHTGCFTINKNRHVRHRN